MSRPTDIKKAKFVIFWPRKGQTWQPCSAVIYREAGPIWHGQKNSGDSLSAAHKLRAPGHQPTIGEPLFILIRRKNEPTSKGPGDKAPFVANSGFEP